MAMAFKVKTEVAPNVTFSFNMIFCALKLFLPTKRVISLNNLNFTNVAWIS